MTGTRDKLRSLFLAALMVFSVFGGTVAFAGTAAAANSSVPASGVGNQAADSYGGDNTQNTSALSGEEVLVTDIDFSGDSSGSVNNVTVTMNESSSANLAGGDVTSVRVVTLNGSTVVAEESASLDSQLSTIVDFNGTAADADSAVDGIEVYATLASSSVINGNEVLDAGIEIFADDGTSFSGTSPYDTQNVQSVTTQSSFISGEVEDSNGDPINNAQVEIVNADNGATVTTLTTDSDGEFDPSRIRVAPGQNYTVNVERFGYTTYSQTQFVGSQETVDFPVTLEFNLQPDSLDVKRFDGNLASGDSSTLLGNGESDTKSTYAVIVENSSVESGNTPIDESSFSLDVDLEFNTSDPTVGDFVDNDAVGNTTSVTTTERGDIDGDGYNESYALVEVTADAANSSTLADPLTEVGINASNAENNLNDNGASVQYVLEGEEKITGEVVDLEGEPVSGATVWAVYEGTGNESLEFTENTFVNDDNRAFLVDQTNEDGRYTVPGLAGNNTNVTIYVDATNYNRENLTGTTVGQFVAASEFEQTAGTGAETENHDIVLTPVDITLEYRLDLTAEDEDGNFVDVTSMPINSNRDVKVGLEVKAQNEPDSEYTPIENSTLVDSESVNITTSNPTIGDVVDDQLTVTTSGQTTPFQSTRSTGTTTLTAEVTNSEGTEFNDTAVIEVFGVGEITGDIVNDENPADNLPGATVELFRVENNGSETLLETDTAGPEGSYSFTQVRTGETYRVVATFEGETGFNELFKSSAGTTNADVVIVGVTPDAANFEVSNLSPTDVTVTQGDLINVSATITNTGDEIGTQSVDFRVGGTTLASENVELTGDENETVSFTGIDTSGLSAGNYTHGVYTDDDQQTAQLTVEAASSGSNWYDAYVDQNDVVDDSGLNAAISDYLSGGLSDSRLNSVISSYLGGSPI